jgi:amino acid transporter
LVSALGFYWPAVTAGGLRVALITGVALSIMAVNIRGIRQSSLVVNILTIAKLTPLALFIVFGLPHVAIGVLRPESALTWAQVSNTALLLIFTFGGYEVIPVPAGEARDPRRGVPFAMITTIIVVTVVLMLVQIVALGTLPGLADSKTPLADAALIFIGAGGALLMTAGAAVSVAGNNMGAALSGSRSLFALAEQGDVPRVFGHIHARYRTPDVAIVATCLTTLVLALTGSFVQLAAVSAIGRLMVYAGTCASVLRLRRQGPAPFTMAGGSALPILALLVCVAMLASATVEQLQRGSLALVAGAALFLIARRKT